MALALCLLAWVLWVLLRAVRQARVSDDPLDHLTQVNAAVYREQWAEIDRDRQRVGRDLVEQQAALGHIDAQHAPTGGQQGLQA